jgi:phage terminase small subunit
VALSEKERRFCVEYAADPNGTQAYLRAFPGCTYHTARNAAARLLQKIAVQAELKAARNEYARRCRVDATRLLRDIANLAHADPGDVLENGPSGEPVLREWKTITPAARKFVAKVKMRRRRLVNKNKPEDTTEWEVEDFEVQFRDTQIAQEKLCKHLGLTKEGAGLEQLLALLSGSPSRDKADIPAVSPGSGPESSSLEGGEQIAPEAATDPPLECPIAQVSDDAGCNAEQAGPDPVS